MRRHFIAAFALIATATAQSIAIRTPLPGDIVTLGGAPLVVEIDKPLTISESESVSVVIGLQSCGRTVCAPNDAFVGDLLFKGDYIPVLHDDDPFKPPYQNFTFNLAHLPAGNATLHFAHFFLLGAGLSPMIQTTSVDIVIRGAAGK